MYEKLFSETDRDALVKGMEEMHADPQGLSRVAEAAMKEFDVDANIAESIRKTAELVEANSSMDTPPYHNRTHFMDVVMATARLAKSEGIDDEKASLMILAAVGHDVGHPGGTNDPGALEQLERNSVSILQDGGALDGLKPEQAKFVADLIEGTDHPNHAKDSRENYERARSEDSGMTPEEKDRAVGIAVLRQADLFGSIIDPIRGGETLQAELVGAQERQEHLKAPWVAGLSNPSSQEFFEKGNPCFIQGGDEIREWIGDNMTILAQQKESESLHPLISPEAKKEDLDLQKQFALNPGLADIAAEYKEQVQEAKEVVKSAGELGLSPSEVKERVSEIVTTAQESAKESIEVRQSLKAAASTGISQEQKASEGVKV